MRADVVAGDGALGIGSRREQSRRLFARVAANHVGTSLLGTAAVQLLGVLTGILLARTLGPAGRGAFAAMVLWPTVTVTAGDFGLANALAFYSAKEPRARSALWEFARR